jgi:hypothetical protein
MPPLAAFKIPYSFEMKLQTSNGISEPSLAFEREFSPWFKHTRIRIGDVTFGVV